MKSISAVALAAAVVISTSLAVSAQAAPKAKSAPMPRYSDPAGSSTWGSQKGIKGMVSGPISLLDGTLLFGPYFDALYEVAPNIEIGGGTGFLIGSQSAGGISATYWAIPITPMGIYHFRIPDLHDIAPFVGASMGLVIAHAGVSATATVGTTTVTAGDSGTSANFTFMAHIGAAFGADKNIIGDLKLGTMAGSFLFAPTVGYSFNLM